jgi:hypothetical protein
MENELEKLLEHIKAEIDLDRDTALGPEYFYASLPLCVIDAVYSIGVKYTGTRNTVVRWCKHEHWPEFRNGAHHEHSMADFLTVLRRYTDEQLARDVFGNLQRTSSRSGKLKSTAVRKFAEVLSSERIERFVDMRSDDAVERVEPRIKSEVPGQSSGISFDYFMMLAGSDDYIKADRMICRFVAHALGKGAENPERARKLLFQVTQLLRQHHGNLTPRTLDHAIWKYQSSKDRSAARTNMS